MTNRPKLSYTRTPCDRFGMTTLRPFHSNDSIPRTVFHVFHPVGTLSQK